MRSRITHNRAIVKKLAELVEKYPKYRFQQLLFATGIIEKKDDEIIDKFYEESKITWDKMAINDFCFPT